MLTRGHQTARRHCASGSTHRALSTSWHHGWAFSCLLHHSTRLLIWGHTHQPLLYIFQSEEWLWPEAVLCRYLGDGLRESVDSDAGGGTGTRTASPNTLQGVHDDESLPSITDSVHHGGGPLPLEEVHAVGSGPA